MKISELINYLESLVPLSMQESYDNSGIQCGDAGQEAKEALLTLDCTEEVLDEAIRHGCNMVLSHHPVIFGKGLKRLTGSTYPERIIIKAIQNNIVLYAMHTNLDNFRNGVNQKICNKLGILNPSILELKPSSLFKLVTFVPVLQADEVRDALFEAGAGNIGNYSECSFNVMGTGTFKANEQSNPFVGKIGKQHREQELRVEVICPDHSISSIVRKLKEVHPYEEVAYDIYPLLNANPVTGAGMIGDLENAISEDAFLDMLKEKMQAKVVRHTRKIGKKVKKIAVCGGAGSFLLSEAIRQKADVFVTGDFKYHQFFDADGKLMISDIGHYESEQFTSELLMELVSKKFPTFAVRLSKTNTNPINYY